MVKTFIYLTLIGVLKFGQAIISLPTLLYWIYLSWSGETIPLWLSFLGVYFLVAWVWAICLIGSLFEILLTYGYKKTTSRLGYFDDKCIFYIAPVAFYPVFWPLTFLQILCNLKAVTWDRKKNLERFSELLYIENFGLKEIARNMGVSADIVIYLISPLIEENKGASKPDKKLQSIYKEYFKN